MTMTSTTLPEEQKQDRMGMDTSRSTIDSVHQHKQMRRKVKTKTIKSLMCTGRGLSEAYLH